MNLHVRIQLGVMDLCSDSFSATAAINRTSWTNEEVEELKQYFKEHISTRSTPGMKDCQRAIQMSRKHNGVLHKRPWETIKKKVWNMIKKF